ncbi:MAG: amidohydrolase family protein [Betaproteobacteria bacterium]|nr:MAG: amidohydrolase family protein [Betaproteobacteria bacterium]
MTPLLFKNARIFDGTDAECAEGMYLRISDGLIQEISPKPVTDKDARLIDLKGRTLMPGLIDAHMHAYCSDVSMQKVEAMGEPYRTVTTVRDIGGGDYSLAKAIADGLVRAPRFFYAGKVLSMTGGHGDFRPLEQKSHNHELCPCGIVNWACRMADGVDACIQAARDELRQGAHCIKIMGSGGVASPTDPIWMNQYREDEIRAIVNECAERRTYVAAHCHPASAIRRCVEFGVRSIEHGTLIDDDTAKFVAERGAYIVPTMVVIFALVETGKELGFSAVSLEKAEYAYKQALSGMDKMRSAGVKIGFGTDLLGSTYVQECREFTIRSEVFTPLELLRQATSVNAELMLQQGKLGCIAPGAHADLLVVDGDPLKDISLLAANGKNLRMIVRGGEVVKDELR